MKSILKHKCPVCGKTIFEEEGYYEVCEVCGWIDDLYQEEFSDEGGLANDMSLNEARAAYARGEAVV
jgi:uncharacterized Zn finger protein (UPF0148 family)